MLTREGKQMADNKEVTISADELERLRLIETDYLELKASEQLTRQRLERAQKRRRQAEQRLIELTRDRNQWLVMYQAVTHCFSWKLTAPMRAVSGFIKRLMRSNPVTGTLLKGLASIRRIGWSATWQRLKHRRRHIRSMKERGDVSYVSPQDIAFQTNYHFDRDIKFSIIVPLYNTPLTFLTEMIQSVIDQTYANWELCLADGSDDAHNEVGHICRELAEKEPRILYKKLDHNLGISGNTNAALEMATGTYIALFDHDDLLHRSVLFEVMKVICERNADFIYTDEMTFEGTVTNVITAHFKPDYAIDNLRANNYICHFSVFSRELYDKVGGFRHEYDGSQDHDMILRLTGNAKTIAHIPKLLYFWRSHPASVAADINSKTYAIDAGKRAVRDSIREYGYDAEVESSKAFPTIYRLKYKLKSTPLISILIPSMDHIDELRTCIESIMDLSTYPRYEIVIVENNSRNKETFEYYEDIQELYDNVRVVNWSGEFNYAAINNFGAAYTNGEYLVLMNNDIEVITPEWMEEMLMYCQRDDVGAVGAKLYYPDDTIQHAGIVIGMGKDRVAGHTHYGMPRESVGYMGRLYFAQDVSAVTAACAMFKKSLFDKVGGLNEKLSVAFNDVDLCLKIRKLGYLVVFTPYAELYHYESVSRGLEDTPEKKARFEREAAYFREIWRTELEAGDPYFNPNFSLDYSDFTIA